MSLIINIRDRRQITLPADILKQLDLSIGDRLALQVKKRVLVAKPVRSQAIESLKAIQKVFQKAKINEDELQEEGRRLRKRLSETRYGQE